MTAGTPAPQDAETVDVLAKAFYVAMNADDRAWAAAAWEDMGGSEPSAERADIEVAMTEALAALAAVRAREVEAARREAEHAALREAATIVRTWLEDPHGPGEGCDECDLLNQVAGSLDYRATHAETEES